MFSFRIAQLVRGCEQQECVSLGPTGAASGFPASAAWRDEGAGGWWKEEEEGETRCDVEAEGLGVGVGGERREAYNGRYQKCAVILMLV